MNWFDDVLDKQLEKDWDGLAVQQDFEDDFYDIDFDTEDVDLMEDEFWYPRDSHSF